MGLFGALESEICSKVSRMNWSSINVKVHILYYAVMSSKSVGFARYQGVRKVHDTALQIYLITHLINFSLEVRI